MGCSREAVYGHTVRQRAGLPPMRSLVGSPAPHVGQRRISACRLARARHCAFRCSLPWHWHCIRVLRPFQRAQNIKTFSHRLLRISLRAIVGMGILFQYTCEQAYGGQTPPGVHKNLQFRNAARMPIVGCDPAQVHVPGHAWAAGARAAPEGHGRRARGTLHGVHTHARLVHGHLPACNYLQHRGVGANTGNPWQQCTEGRLSACSRQHGEAAGLNIVGLENA